MMKCAALTRENVASHLQKYRLMLKRQAQVSDSTVTSDADWALLEAVHAAHIASLQPPLTLSPAAVPTAAPLTEPPTSIPAPAAVAPTASAHAATPPHPRGASEDRLQPPCKAPRGLPPLLPATMPGPASALVPVTPPARVPVVLACSNFGLPPGFCVPAANADGEAVGIPMPFNLFTASTASSKSGLPTPSQSASAKVTDQTAAHVGPTLSPLALPANPSSLMPASFDPEGLSRRLEEALEHNPAAGGVPMCAVYAFNPASVVPSAGSPHGFLVPAAVPQPMLEMSMAAYGASAFPPGAAPHTKSAVSSGSASKKDRDREDRDLGTFDSRIRRRRTPRRSPRGASSLRRSATGAASAPDGATSALDMLAEVAGRLSGNGKDNGDATG
jgi:hypothetical protein